MTDTITKSDSNPSKHTGKKKLLIVGAALLVAVGLAVPAAIFGPQMMGFEQRSKEAGANPPAGAPAEAPKPTDLIEFRDDKAGVGLSYPSSWEKLPPKNPGDVRLILRTQDGPREAFLVMVARELSTPVGKPEIDAAIKESAAQITGGANKAEMLSAQPYTLGGLPGYWFLYTIQNPDSNQVQIHSHFVAFKGQTVINLSYRTTPGESFDKFAPTFDQINTSFHVLK